MLNFDSATILVKSAGTANLGGLTVPMTSEYLSKDPQHRKQVVVVNFFLFSVRTVKVTNGREIWVKSDNHPAMLLTGADVDVERKLDYCERLVPCTRSWRTLSTNCVTSELPKLMGKQQQEYW